MPGRICLWCALLALCGLSWLIVGVPAAAQEMPPNWQPLGGPGGRITHLSAAADGLSLYAVGVTGVNRQDDWTQWNAAGNARRSDALYRSEDGGATWQPATNDLPPGAITALHVAADSGDVYAGVQGLDGTSGRRSRLWHSPDRGRHWQPVPMSQTTPPLDALLIRRITGSADGRYLYLGTTSTGERPDSFVYRSGDNGRTWSVYPALPPDRQAVDKLANLIPHPARPDRAFITTYSGELLISNDAGQTWRLVGEPAHGPEAGAIPAQLAFRPDAPDTALLVRGPGSPGADTLAVAASTDGGSTWRTIPASGLPAQGGPRALVALPGGVFLLNTTSGTYRSPDGGATWQPLEGALSAGEVAEFLVLPGAAAAANQLRSEPGAAGSAVGVIAATGYGIFASRDHGALWQPYGSGLPFNSKVAGLLTHPERVEQVLAINDNRSLWGTVSPPMILGSPDGGRRWAPASAGLPDVPVTAWTMDPNDPDALFVASWDYVFRSTDAGVTWQTARLDSSAHAAITVAGADSNVVYLGGSPALRSTDRGVTWQPIPVVAAGQASQPHDVTGLVVDAQDAGHVWAALAGGVYESRDAGRSWQALGLAGRAIRWLAAGAPSQQAGGGAATGPLYAGVAADGIYRWDGAGPGWTAASAGLPEHTTILSFAADPRRPGLLWAARDGGGVYRSTDGGAHWSNIGVGVGENLALALAVDYSAPDSVLMGTATAGLWAMRAGAQPAPAAQTPVTSPAVRTGGQAGIDARIELVWPHDWAPVNEANLANLGLRLLNAQSLVPPSCGWRPKVIVWQAANTDPAVPLAQAEQRSVDGQPFPVWELNDVDVSRATDPKQKLFFMVRVEGVDTASSIWAHGADPRTYFPQQDAPSGIAAGQVDAVDARIQIVWPHDEAGNPRPVTEGTLANVAVVFFQHGTRLAMPVGWQPAGLTLFGAWDQEVGRPLARPAVQYTRQAGAITYPVWEFHNIPVARATTPQAQPQASGPEGSTPPGSTLYLWVMADGVKTYPNIWAHGADSRTYFPAQDEPIQGCVP